MSEVTKSQKEYSASSLGKELGIDSKEIFQKLVNLKYIIKTGDTWELTPLGKNKGGQYKDSTYGKYIAWPESIVSEIKGETSPEKEKQSNPPGFIKTQNIPSPKLSITKEEQTIISKVGVKQADIPFGKVPPQHEDKTITATTLGKQYDLPPSRINSIFSELGWIAKDIKGWQITDLGKRVGGIQSRDHVSGVPYVRWPEAVAKNPLLIKSVAEAKGESTAAEKIQNPAVSHEEVGFRDKFKAECRAQDGHYVRSKAEVIIDNWLYVSKTVHAYERKLPIEEDVYCDFYIPTGKVYIEYWGSEEEKYLTRKEIKIKVYQKNNFKFIQLTDKDILNIDDVLPRELLKYGIVVE